MYKDALSKNHFGWLLLALLFFTSCPPDRPIPYPISVPLMMAFSHQIDIDSVENKLAEHPHLQVWKIDDGIQLSCHPNMMLAYDIWLNDSVLVVYLNAYYADRRDGVNTQSGKALFEQKRRNAQADLLKEIPRFIANSVFRNPGEYSKYGTSSSGLGWPEVVDVEKIIPLANFDWKSSAFNIQGQFHFEDGVLQDSFMMRDSSHSLLVKGTFDKGLAVGDWQYFDLLDNLQWTEIFRKGELTDVNYAEGATIKRDARPWTLKELTNLSWFFLFLFLVFFGILFYFYIKSYKGYRFPHRKKSGWVIFGLVLASPIIAISTSILCVIFLIVFMILLSGMGWDLPFEFFNILFIGFTLCFPIGLINYITTLRHQDIFWHAGLVCLGLLFFQTFLFLKDLGV